MKSTEITTGIDYTNLMNSQTERKPRLIAETVKNEEDIVK